MYKQFHEQFEYAFEKCFPLKNFDQNYSNKIEWLSKGLKGAIQNKNRLYRISMSTPSKENILHYKRYKTQLNKILRKEERAFHKSKIEVYKNDFKKS